MLEILKYLFQILGYTVLCGFCLLIILSFITTIIDEIVMSSHKRKVFKKLREQLNKQEK